jgi:hypothetical protein
MILIYQPPNAHERISWILLRNAMAAAAVKKIHSGENSSNLRVQRMRHTPNIAMGYQFA